MTLNLESFHCEGVVHVVEGAFAAAVLWGKGDSGDGGMVYAVPNELAGPFVARLHQRAPDEKWHDVVAVTKLSDDVDEPLLRQAQLSGLLHAAHCLRETEPLACRQALERARALGAAPGPLEFETGELLFRDREFASASAAFGRAADAGFATGALSCADWTVHDAIARRFHAHLRAGLIDEANADVRRLQSIPESGITSEDVRSLDALLAGALEGDEAWLPGNAPWSPRSALRGRFHSRLLSKQFDAALADASALEAIVENTFTNEDVVYTRALVSAVDAAETVAVWAPTTLAWWPRDGPISRVEHRLGEKKNLDRALADATALAAGSGNPLDGIFACEVLALCEEWQKVETLCTPIVTGAPDDGIYNVLTTEGEARFRHRDRERTRDVHFRAFMLRGRARTALSKWDDALTDFQAAATIYSHVEVVVFVLDAPGRKILRSEHDLQIYRAHASAGAGKWADAVTDLRAAIPFRPEAKALLADFEKRRALALRRR